MNVLIACVMALTAVSGLVVVLTRDPHKQLFALSANGLVLAILFFVLQAPDVALSEIAVGAAFVPLLYLATLTSVGNARREADSEEDEPA